MQSRCKGEVTLLAKRKACTKTPWPVRAQLAGGITGRSVGLEGVGGLRGEGLIHMVVQATVRNLRFL